MGPHNPESGPVRMFKHDKINITQRCLIQLINNNLKFTLYRYTYWSWIEHFKGRKIIDFG